MANTIRPGGWPNQIGLTVMDEMSCDGCGQKEAIFTVQYLGVNGTLMYAGGYCRNCTLLKLDDIYPGATLLVKLKPRPDGENR